MNAEFVFSAVISTITNPLTMGMTFVGTFMGLVFGALPGLNTSLAIALLIPITYTMPSEVAFGMMMGTYVGGMSGGAVSAILLGIPGTPAAVVTSFDGYPMAKNGRGAEAMGWAAISSGIGSVFSWVVLIFFSPVLAAITLTFSSPEYAMLILFGMTIIISMGEKNMSRGLLCAALGIFLGCIGLDPAFGLDRLTFNNLHLMGGLEMMPMIIGMLAVPQVLEMVDTRTQKMEKMDLGFKNYIPSLARMWKTKLTWAIGCIIGTFVGIIPATGAPIATFMSYDRVKKWSKHPERFGKGTHHGVAVAECANNAVCGGALVPLLTLGIPGDGITAVMMGAFIIQGLRPGPSFFVQHPDLVVTIFTCFFVGTLMFLVIQLGAIKFFIKILSVPNCYLCSGIIVVCMGGVFAMGHSLFDVYLSLGLGFASYFLLKGGFPLPCMMLGLVLGDIFERELRVTWAQFGSLSPFYTRPIALVFMIIALLAIGTNVYKTIKDTWFSSKK